jgi:hypothetical protein
MERLSAADVGAASVAGSRPPEDRMERLSVPVGETLRAAVPTAAAHGGRPEPAAALNVQPVAGVRHARQAVAAERGGRPVAAVQGAEAVPAAAGAGFRRGRRCLRRRTDGCHRQYRGNARCGAKVCCAKFDLKHDI